MKTIVRNDSNVSLYLFDDGMKLQINSTGIIVGDPVEFIIGDCNSNNVTVVSGIDAPEDWKGCKYLYASGEWSLNPEWIEPE